MLVLAVDTSLPLLSVALLSDDAVVGAVALEGKGSRNEKLLPAIDWVLAENGIDRRAIDLFAVTRGPGSFTGVRIGLATIQGLALAIARPVCAMSTHEAVAAGSGGRVLVTDDAGRGEFYVSVWERGEESVAPRLANEAALRELTAGAGVISIGAFIRSHNVAVSCARRALQIQAAGRIAAYEDATPLYVRLAEAEVKLRENAGA